MDWLRRVALGVMGFAVLGGVTSGRAQPIAVAEVAGAGQIDFSTVGYGGGPGALPAVPVAARVLPGAGDATAAIQAALDHVAALPAGAEGFRGAVELAAGRFAVGGQLVVRGRGVVLRGTGAETVIVATGMGRRTLLVIGGRETLTSGPAVPVIDATVPAGATRLRVGTVAGLAVGDRVVVRRPSTRAWISLHGADTDDGPFAADRTHWRPGGRDLVWDRRIVALDAATGALELDAPLTTALEGQHGGGTLARRAGAGEGAFVAEPAGLLGVERLTLESTWDPANPHDEEHAWIAVALDHVEDAWVRDVTTRHFVSSAVRVGLRARRVTIEAVRAEAPVSELGGGRRESFVVAGQQVLVRGCAAEDALNAFTVAQGAGGPVVFFNCTARRARGTVGPVEAWASGVLYENVRVEGAALRLGTDDGRAQGAWWTAAHSVVWNCTATGGITVRSPVGAANFHVEAPGESLLAAQAERRGVVLGNAAPTRATVPTPTVVTTATLAPTVGDVTVREFRGGAAAWIEPPLVAAGAPGLEIVNGRFVIGGRTLWGGAVNAAWWRGALSTSAVPPSGVSITRFVPGREGPGLTEDLPALAAKLVADGTPFYAGGPGLWYDRRRDAHGKEAMPDAEVWAPFYELPWARTGSGRAADGLSRYDLARFNPWYFARLRAWAQLSRAHGLVCLNFHYNTHNLLETVAHWVDYPWRPANHVNATGLPDLDVLDERAAIHVAEHVFDPRHPVRRELHRALIRQQLAATAGEPNVLHSLAFQFVGPLAMQQFFLDVVAEWERETGHEARVALVTSRDITEAILADPVRAAQVDVIDLRYWQRLADGSWWAPVGDGRLAFREQNAVLFGRAVDTPPDSTARFVYEHVRDYRTRFPEKAVVAWHGGVGALPVLMAGGAQALMRNPAAGHGQDTVDRTPLDGFVQDHLARDLAQLTPRDGWLADGERVWCLADDSRRTVLIAALGDVLIVPVVGTEGSGNSSPLDGLCGRAWWCDPRTGVTRAVPGEVTLRAGATLKKPTAEDWLLLMRSAP